MRELPKHEILDGLKAGRTLVIQRKDDPNLPYLNELVNVGLVDNELVQYDEQGSVLKFRWIEG